MIPQVSLFQKNRPGEVAPGIHYVLRIRPSIQKLQQDHFDILQEPGRGHKRDRHTTGNNLILQITVQVRHYIQGDALNANRKNRLLLVQYFIIASFP
jgi:hypothetical protein